MRKLIKLIKEIFIIMENIAIAEIGMYRDKNYELKKFNETRAD